MAKRRFLSINKTCDHLHVIVSVYEFFQNSCRRMKAYDYFAVNIVQVCQGCSNQVLEVHKYRYGKEMR